MHFLGFPVILFFEIKTICFGNVLAVCLLHLLQYICIFYNKTVLSIFYEKKINSTTVDLYISLKKGQQ